MIKMYIARHGETEENVRQLLQGWSPGNLTDEGRCQAHALAAQLSGVRFDAVVSSPLRRALDTAEIVMRENSRPQPIQTCDALRERNWGSLTMQPYAEVHAMAQLPPDVETLPQAMERAAEFAREMLRRFDGQTILAVGHGFIDRCIIAAIEGKDKRLVPRMENAEFRIVSYDAGMLRDSEARLRASSASPDEVAIN